MLMKAISIRQPWAGLIAAGLKSIEVRSWRTSYRGPLIIAACAEDELPADCASIETEEGRIIQIRRGVTLCKVDLTECRALTPADHAAAYLDPAMMPEHAYAWVLQNPRKTPMRRVRGMPGLYEISS